MIEIYEKNAIILCRVSTAKQAGENESLDDQERIGRKKAEYLRANVLKVFRFTISGAKSERDDIEMMIKYVEDYLKRGTKVHYLIIKDIDRLTRGGNVVYQEIKKRFADLGVDIVDGFGMIQPKVNLYEDMGIDYDWCWQSNSEMAERYKADISDDERKIILRRLIVKEVELTRAGFHIGPPQDGYINKKLPITQSKSATIQIPDPSRGQFMVKMFELRALRLYTDIEVVKMVNALGYKTRERNRWSRDKERIIGKSGGRPLTVKQLQRIIQNPIYCGVKVHKYTGYKPVKQKYPGLVSIDLFNRANNGKVFVKEISADECEVLYDYKPFKQIQKRNKYNENFPYKGVILCPHCKKPLKASASKGRSKHYYNYHCQRSHAYIGVSKDELEQTVDNFILSLSYNKNNFDELKNALLNIFRKKQSEITKESVMIDKSVLELKTKKEQAIDILLQNPSQSIKNSIEKRIDDFDKEIDIVQSKRKIIEITEKDISDFIKYAKHLLEHLDELLLNNPLIKQKQALFSLVFDELPSYFDIKNGTAKISSIFQIAGQNNFSVARRGVEPLFLG